MKQIIITSPSGHRQYRITPLDNGLCYQIHQTPTVAKIKDGKFYGKNGHEIKEPWVFTKKYPNSLEFALKLVYEMMLNDPEDELEINLDAEASWKAINKSIDAWTKKALVEIK